MIEEKLLCIYHGNCADGFGAAWAVWKARPETEFVAGVHSEPPPDVTGRDVLLVDFSYKRDVLLGMAKEAKSILILDHHKSAQEDLVDLPSNVTAVFDMDRSGARMAWDYFFPGESPPRLIDHIQDRDLWRFKLSGTREIQSCVFSYPYDFDTWDWLMQEPLENLLLEGKALNRKHMKDVEELVSVTIYRRVIGGFNIPVANLPYTLSSEAGHIMAHGNAFAACYWDVCDGRVFSLRSNPEGEDVSAIAKRYGGGGHRSAAGFKVGLDHPLCSR